MVTTIGAKQPTKLMSNRPVVVGLGTIQQKGNYNELDEALLLSKKILSKYHGGLDFSALAIDYSDDPSAPSNKGSLGWVEWGLKATEFQNAAFNL